MLETIETLLTAILMLILAGYTFYFRNNLVLLILVFGVINLVSGDTNTEWYASIASNVLAGLVTLVLVQYMRLQKHNEDVFYRARLASIVDSSDDAIIGVDLNSRIFSWNKAAERLYGWTEKEVRGKSYEELTVPEDSRVRVSDILERLLKGENVPPYTTIRCNKEGKKTNVYVTMSPIRMYPTNEVIGASVIVRPVGAKYD